MSSKSTILVFGGSGRTGRHFVEIALKKGHKVRALVRDPAKLAIRNPNLDLRQGSIVDGANLDELLEGVESVVCMLGDAKMQSKENVNTAFVKKLIPAMRRHDVKKFLYQAGGATKPYKENLPFGTWLLKNTLVRMSGLLGQHRDNEAVIEYLVEEAPDIDWVVHRAGIFSDGPSKGTLVRSKDRVSMASFVDTATYNYNALNDPAAVHTYDMSVYKR